MEVFGSNGQLNFTAGITTDLFFSQRDKLLQGIRGLSKEANDQTASIENLYKKASTAIAGYLSLSAGTALIKDIVRVRGEFEQLSVAFETMLGSKQEADQLMSEVVKFAATTPYGLTEVAQTTKQLLAYGVAAGDISDTLRSLGDVAAGVSQPLSDIAYLYGTIKTAGVANAVDIKQFAQRGIPIYDALAKVLKVNVDEVGAFVSAGKVGFPQIEAAFKSMTGAGSQFGGLMEKTSHTLTGVISNLEDSFDQMLNNIGKANSGLAYSVLGFAQKAVDNYQSIVDILKVAVTVYGSYRTAVLLAVAAERLQQESMLQTALAGKELTGVQASLAAAQRLIQGSAKGIFDTIVKALPTAGLTAGVAALGVVLYSLTQTTDAAAEAQKTLAGIEADAAKSAVSQTVQVNTLVGVLKDKKSTHEETITALNKLREATGPYLKNYTDEQILAGKAKGAIDDYIKSINDLAKAQAAKNKLVELQEQLIDIDNKAPGAVDKMEALGQSLKATFGQGDYSKQSWIDQLLYGKSTESAYFDHKKEVVQAQIDAITGKYGEGLKKLALGNTVTDPVDSLAKQTNKQLIDATKSLEDLSALRQKIDDQYNKSNDQANRDALASDLKYADARKKLFDTFGADKVAAKTNEEAIGKINSLLDRQKSLLQEINDLHHDAIQSGLLPQDSELDKINEKYARIFESIQEQNDLYDKINAKYPGGIAAFNKANPANPVSKVDQNSINQLNSDKNTEILNTNYKEQAEAYVKNLDNQKKVFEQYQDSIRDIGIDRANELYAGQTKGFQTYVDYLKGQSDTIQKAITGPIADIGSQIKLKGIGEELAASEKEASDKQYADTLANYTRIIGLTTTFNQQRKNLDEKYQKDRTQLESTYKGEDLQQRLTALKDYYDNEKKQVDESEVYQSDVYKKLNENIVLFTRQQLEQRVKDLNKILNTTAGLTPQMKADIQSGIDKLKGLLDSTDQTDKNLDKLSSHASEIQNAFSGLASSLQGINGDLSDTLSLVANVISGFVQASKSLKDYHDADKDDPAAKIAAGVGIVSGVLAITGTVLNFFKAAKDSRIAAQKELDSYNNSLIIGETDYNLLLRERARTIADINNLNTVQLKQQQQLLSLQKQQAQQDYNALLLKIQQSGSQVISETIKKSGGIFGIGAKSKTVQELAGLSDVNYDQLEELFTEGKLDDATSKWFSELQKTHDELAAIGESAQDVADRLNQIYTGTTADAIADSIEQGFEKGYSTVNDFGDNLSDILRKAILSAFEADQIKPAIQSIYDQIGQLNSDGSLDAIDISQIKANYNATLSALLDKFNAVKQAAGSIFSDTASSSQNALTGSTSQATEQTTEILAGQMGALRITAAEHLQIATQSLNQLVLITNYAADIPNIKEILRQMNTNGIKIR